MNRKIKRKLVLKERKMYISKNEELRLEFRHMEERGRSRKCKKSSGRV